MKLAQIQMHVTADKAANLRHAEDLLRSVRGADMAILPEMFCCPYDNACFRAYGEPEGGPAYQMLSRTARELNLWLVGGSLPELDGDKIYNTAYVFDPDGHLRGPPPENAPVRYRCAGRPVASASPTTLSPGNDITLFDTPYRQNRPVHLLRPAVRGAVPRSCALRGRPGACWPRRPST